MPAVSNTVAFIVNQLLFDLTLLFEDKKKLKSVCGEKEGKEGEGGGS